MSALTHKLTNEQYERLSSLIEQIGGLNNLLFLAAQNEIEKSNEAMTAHILIREKYDEARRIVDAAEIVNERSRLANE